MGRLGSVRKGEEGLGGHHCRVEPGLERTYRFRDLEAFLGSTALQDTLRQKKHLKMLPMNKSSLRGCHLINTFSLICLAKSPS